MVNRVEIEGSKERAADRGSAEGLVIPENQDRSLAVPSVVEGIVRQWLMDLMDIRLRWLKDEISGDQAIEEMRLIHKGAQAIFYGRAEGYETTSWNAEQGLGRHLVNKVVGGEVQDAVFRTFYFAASEILPGLQDHAAGKMNDDMMEAMIEELISRYAAHMLGLPPEMLTGTSE